jgi:cation diffusion facilitator CzcD-associated flavoprotein CzcO
VGRHGNVRRKILHDQSVFTGRAFSEPETVKRELIGAVRSYLGPHYDADTHFTPRYRPWRQRIAFIPDGDSFQGIRTGRASTVTRHGGRRTATLPAFRSGRWTTFRPPVAVLHASSSGRRVFVRADDFDKWLARLPARKAG